MYIINSIVSIIAIIIGINIRRNKRNYLIIGYNKLDEKERQLYNEGKPLTTASNIFIISGILLIIGGILAMRSPVPNYLTIVSWGVFILFIFGGTLYINAEYR